MVIELQFKHVQEQIRKILTVVDNLSVSLVLCRSGSVEIFLWGNFTLGSKIPLRFQSWHLMDVDGHHAGILWVRGSFEEQIVVYIWNMSMSSLIVHRLCHGHHTLCTFSHGQMFQVKFVPEMIQSVYLSFGSFEAARERFLLLAGNVVSNTAQEYTPSDFWSKRRTISDRMLFKINHTLWHQGYVEAMQFEIMKVSNKFFSPKGRCLQEFSEL